MLDVEDRKSTRMRNRGTTSFMYKLSSSLLLSLCSSPYAYGWFGYGVRGIRRMTTTATAGGTTKEEAARKLAYLEIKSPSPSKTIAFFESLGLDKLSDSTVAYSEGATVGVVPTSSPEGQNRDTLYSLTLHVTDVATTVASVESFGNADVLRAVENVTYVASLYPDEDIDMPQPWCLRAVLRDKSSGFQVELMQYEGLLNDALRCITLQVHDLDAALDFYSSKTGMRIRRKQSLVPTEPALSAFLSYESDQTSLELRYKYGSKELQPLTGRAPSIIVISTPSISDAIAGLGGEQSACLIEGLCSDETPTIKASPDLNFALLDELEFAMLRVGISQ